MVYAYTLYRIKLDLLFKDWFRIEKQEWKSGSETYKIMLDPDPAGEKNPNLHCSGKKIMIGPDSADPDPERCCQQEI